MVIKKLTVRKKPMAGGAKKKMNGGNGLTAAQKEASSRTSESYFEV